MRGRVRGFFEEWRPSAVTLGAPAFPLAVLFGLNAVDELDRTAFAVLLPDIRDHFGLTDAGALALVAVTTVAVIFIEVPLSFYCDRRNRVRIARNGAALWALFSLGTGLATSVAMLVAMRIGAGAGRAVVNPTHSSLLSDWYEPRARVKVFSVHRQGNSVGQILGPLLGGGLAWAFGWRTPFLLFAIPTAIFVLLSLRLREPVRGGLEHGAPATPAAPTEPDAPTDPAGSLAHDTPGATEASGAPDAVAAADAAPQPAPAALPPLTVRQSIRALAGVRTIRRIWMAVPFLGIALFGVPNLLSLIYEDVYELDAAQRGLIAAGIEPLQIVGVFLAMPVVARIAMRRPEFLLRFVAVVGVVDGLLLVLLAYSPSLVVAIAVHALLAASIGTLAPAFFALVSLVAPPQVRSASFSTMAVFAIPGIAVFLPVIGAVSDSLGIQASMVVMVPVSLAAGLVLSTAARFVSDDVARNQQPLVAS